ncbi:CAP domain-containing protein [Streptomyces sp. NBC_01236]|uniref:CAP domain-containing protein n=1 Tax=Streptomyces sp. NBC_01236 TaxID=2903789 RepID=UPI002E12B029|nr:CAP domain-containing protein [Streptomyces sp. NBC_01236]
MRKHRRKTRHRQIAIAGLVVSALAVPTAAMACLNHQGTRGAESHGGQWQNWRNTSSEDGWKHREWTSRPSASASQTATTPATTAPAARKTHTPKTAATRIATASKTAAAPKASASSAAPAATTPASSSAVARIVALVNSERSKVGCSPLTLNAKLTKAAQAHSVDMASHQNMSHTGSDGSDPGTRITRAGYIWSSYGENVAYGYSTPEQVMAGWMSSPGHKRNILDCGYKEIGVGLAQPGSYWTQDFGTAR